MNHPSRKSAASARAKSVAAAAAAFVTVVLSLPAGAAPFVINPIPEVQDANLIRCQQQNAEALGQCVGLPVCWADNGICNGPPSDGSCEAQAQIKYEKCLARVPRLHLKPLG